QAGLHAIDDRQLGRSLALGLGALYGLQRGAQGPRHGVYEVGVVRRECVRRLLADGDEADRVVADDERRVDEGVVHGRAAELPVLDAMLLPEGDELLVRMEQDRLPCAKDHAADTGAATVRTRWVVVPLAVVDHIG